MGLSERLEEAEGSSESQVRNHSTIAWSQSIAIIDFFSIEFKG
jgi:hypothetical protein